MRGHNGATQLGGLFDAVLRVLICFLLVDTSTRQDGLFAGRSARR